MSVPVSVVMPVYNQERYVALAIDSILAQTHRDFELLVVDDGSTDATPQILAGIEDPRLRVLPVPHAGFCRALEAGVNAARGTWIARMDSDDLCHPQRLERQLAFLEEHRECLFLGTAYGLLTPHGRSLKPRVGFTWRYVEPSHITLGPRIFADPSVIFHREAALQVGLYDRDFENENPLWYKLLRIGKGAVLGEPLYFARWLLGSASRQKGAQQHAMHLSVRERYDPNNARRLKPRPAPTPTTRMLYLGTRAVTYYLLAGDRPAARLAARQTLRSCPLSPRAYRMFIQSLLGIAAFRGKGGAEYVPVVGLLW